MCARSPRRRRARRRCRRRRRRRRLQSAGQQLKRLSFSKLPVLWAAALFGANWSAAEPQPPQPHTTWPTQPQLQQPEMTINYPFVCTSLAEPRSGVPARYRERAGGLSTPARASWPARARTQANRLHVVAISGHVKSQIRKLVGRQPARPGGDSNDKTDSQVSLIGACNLLTFTCSI